MSSYDDDGDDGDEYANGADGTCQTCGEATSQPWHLLCARCYAAEQGWTHTARPAQSAPARPVRPAREPPAEARLPLAVVAALAVLRAEIAELRDWIAEFERVLDRESRRAA